MKILVVGGGTAGYISALILKKYLDCQIDMVYSDSVGIIGVGEGSTEHFKEFMDFIGITHHDIIKNCDATYKSGIMFEGWGQKKYLHNVGGDFAKLYSQYPFVYARQISNRDNFFNLQTFWENYIETEYINKEFQPPFNQFHFNTYKLNEFLKNLAISRNIKIYEDIIKEIHLSAINGEISFLSGNLSEYHYDFYIDATGFKKLLISRLEPTWESFKDFLRMKSAITFQTEDEENYNLWTLSKTLDYGWLFRIPVWGRYGNGYVFDSDYITYDTAVNEVSKIFNREINPGKAFSFDPGFFRNSWIKNCCAVGLSSNFVEPLEATSIGITIQQSFLLMNRITNYNDKTIESYNKSFKDIMYNVRDFIFLHYMIKKKDSQFWIDMQTINPPDTLKQNLEIWKHKLPIREDFCTVSNYVLFLEHNYINILQGIDFFDVNSIKKEFEKHSLEKRIEADNIIKNLKFRDEYIKRISHKDFLKIIRELI
jgi:tryptophan halogenase